MVEYRPLNPVVVGSSPTALTKLIKWEEALLKTASTDWISSAKLLDSVDPCGHSDDARYAYWSLVSEGRLIRGPKGVRKSN